MRKGRLALIIPWSPPEPSSAPLSSYSGGEGIDTLDLSGSSASQFFAGTAFSVTALALDNNFVSGVEALYAGAGSDALNLRRFTIGTSLYGGGGDDKIRGGTDTVVTST